MGPAAADTISTRDLPREVALLIHAVRDAFAKQTEAIRSQKIFASAISHEVRTPLAIARLELEKIADPRARRVEADLEALNRLVEQLTALARLETTPDAPDAVDLAVLARHVVGALAPLAYEKGKKLALVTEGSGSVQGHSTLIENALRNLIENAIRHAGTGAAIQVVVGPGAQLAVIDDGGNNAACGSLGLLNQNSGDRPGLGLRIVRRIAELHGGQVEIGPQPAGGVLARLRLDAGHELRY
jgi:signal transduction histidine kinase